MVDNFPWNLHDFVRCVEIFPRNLWEFWGPNEVCLVDGTKFSRNSWEICGWLRKLIGIFWTLFDGCRIFPRDYGFFLSLSLSLLARGRVGGGGLGWGCSLLRRPSPLRAALSPLPAPIPLPSFLLRVVSSLPPLLSPFLPCALWRLVGIAWLCVLGSAPPPILLLLLLCNGARAASGAHCRLLG